MTHDFIRTALKQHPDGLTVTEISKHIGKHAGNIARTISVMPDVYIDRWTQTARGAAKYTPVYVAVDVPENAPKPD